jgi:outer membrane protein assembly factor BamE
MKTLYAVPLALCLLAGCATDQDRLMKEQYPSYPDHIKRAIDENYLVPGMDQDQVYLTLGQPMCKKHAQRKGKQVEVWLYPPGGREPCLTAKHRVYFEQGRVTEWEVKQEVK